MGNVRRRTSILATLSGMAVLLAMPAWSHAAEVSFLKTIEVPATTTSGEVTVAPIIDGTKGVACQNIRFATEDGNWQGGFGLLCKSQKFTLSPGNGIKGIYAQAQGALELPDGSFKTVESNIVFVKLRKVAEAPAPAPQPTGPKITAVQVDMPDPAKVNDPMAMPSERLPHVNFTITGAETCTLDSFQYRLTANGAWKDVVNRTRPFVHLDATPGVQNLYVQLVGACNINGDDTYGPQGNIFHTTVNVPDYTKPAPTPQPGVGEIDFRGITVKQVNDEMRLTTDCAGDCFEMRTADERGEWENWQPYKGQIRTFPTAGYGTKGVFVQVRASNNAQSEIKFIKYTYAKTGATTPAPTPTKDTAAPTITSVNITTAFPSRFATVKVAATDDIGVSKIRFANEDGNWGEWQTYKASMPQMMSAGKGYKGIFTQVMDASGKQSTISFTKFTVS